MSMGSWFSSHKRQVITHTSIIAGFVLFTIFLIEPAFERLERIPSEAQLHRLELPAKTNGMRCHIEDISEGPATVEISGWAFIDGSASENSEVYVVLKSDSRVYVFDAAVRERPDVTTYFKELNLNLDSSGFIAIIAARKVAGGEYTVGIYIRKGDIEALQYTLVEIEF